jgi:hypothetical protein
LFAVFGFNFKVFMTSVDQDRFIFDESGQVIDLKPQSRNRPLWFWQKARPHNKWSTHLASSLQEWVDVLNRRKFSEPFLRRCTPEFDSFGDSSHVAWSTVARKQKLSISFIRDHMNRWRSEDWLHGISEQNHLLTEDFVREFQDQLNWLTITSCAKLSEAFIVEFAQKISGRWVAVCQNVSEDFIRQYQDKIEFETLPRRPLSERFMREFADRLDWHEIFHYHKDNLPDSIKTDFAHLAQPNKN